MTRERRPTGRRVATLLFAASIVAASCSSDTKSVATTAASATTAPTTAPTTAGGTETTGAATTSTYAADPTHPIKIGTMIWNLPMINLKTRVAGITAAVDAINARGGIHGRPIKFELCQATDPNSGDDCARKLIADGVVATIADANLVDEPSSTAILAAAGIPQIDPFISSPEAFASPNVFLIAPGSQGQFVATVEFMKLAGVKTMHFLPGALPTAALIEDPMTAVGKKYGITVTGRSEIPLSAADYTPYVSDAATYKADVYVPVIAPFMTDLLLQSVQQLGLKMRFAIGERQFSEEQYKAYGQPGGPLDGALLADVIPPISAAADYPELQRALDEIGVYYKSSNDSDAAPEKLSTVVTSAWLAVQAFAKIADAQTDITATSMMNGLNTMKDIDLGLLKWTPSAKGPPGFEKASNSMQYLSTVKDGKVVMFQKDPIDALASFR